jgi:hypothetical protein
MSKSPFAIFVLAAVCLLAGGRPLAADPPSYASAGIGDDDPLAVIAGDYNLQLVFALQGSGSYVADIRVRIADAAGHSLLEAQSPGPLFYVRLPTGTYRISAEFQGQPVHRSIALTGRGLQTLYFYWPREGVITDERRF